MLLHQKQWKFASSPGGHSHRHTSVISSPQATDRWAAKHSCRLFSLSFTASKPARLQSIIVMYALLLHPSHFSSHPFSNVAFLSDFLIIPRIRFGTWCSASNIHFCNNFSAPGYLSPYRHTDVCNKVHRLGEVYLNPSAGAAYHWGSKLVASWDSGRVCSLTQGCETPLPPPIWTGNIYRCSQ